MRKEFEMSQDQLATLMEACKPVPYMVVNGREPTSPQENANNAWMALGREMGFAYLTVQPIQGKGTEFFTAEITP